MQPWITETPWWLQFAVMLAVIVPVITLSQIVAHLRDDVVDDQLFGYFGWRILHGAVPYVDVWDNKPPGIYWTNALGFLLGGDSYGGVIFLCALALCAAMASFFVIGASVYFRGAAAITTALASFYLTHTYFQGGANRTETFLIAFELTAVALYMRGFARDRWWIWLLAGMCCGAAFLYKQVGLAAWGVMGLHTILLVLLRDVGVLTGLKRCALLLAGMVAVVAAAVGVLHLQGALDEAVHAVFTFNRAYFDVGESSFTNTFVNRYFLWEHMRYILLLPTLMASAAVIHALLWQLRPLLRPPEIEAPLKAFGSVCPRYLLLFSLWFVVAIYGAILSPHRFRHYLVPALPPLLLMSGYLIHVLRTEISLLVRFQQRIWVTFTFLAFGYFAIDAYKWHMEEVSRIWVMRFERRERPEWEYNGEALARLSRPGDRVQCWGYQPGVYLVSRRINATRYATTEKIGQLKRAEESEHIRVELRDRLSADPPEFMVIDAGEYQMCAYPGPGPGEAPPDWLGYWLGETMREKYALAEEVAKTNTYILKRQDLFPAGEILRHPPPLK